MFGAGATSGNPRSGYTLFELIMVVILVGIMFLATAPLMVEISRGWQLATIRTDMSESAVVAMDRIGREIRQIRDNASIVTASASTFRFVDLSNNDITFSLSGGNLVRTINGVSNQLANNVSSLTFTYYNDKYTTALTPTSVPPISCSANCLGTATNIKSIVVNFTLTSGGTNLALQDGVFPRRLQ